MSKLNSLFVLFFATLLLNSCGIGEMMRQAKQSNAIGGKYLLHDNPKAGDYALYKLTGMLRWRGTVDADISFEGHRFIKIEKIENNEIFIREEEVIKNVKVLKMKAGLMSPTVNVVPLLRRIVTDMDGNIKRAHSNFRLDYVLYKAPEAKPGEDNYTVWQPLDQKVAIQWKDKEMLETTPAWSKRRVKMDQGALHFSQNAEFNTVTIQYNNPEVKFLTVMSNEVTLGKTTATLSWDKFLSNLITTLTYTQLFDKPTELLKKMVREGVEDFLFSSSDASKQDEVKQTLKSSGFASNFSMSLNATIGYNLYQFGNSKINYINYKRINEPEGFKK